MIQLLISAAPAIARAAPMVARVAPKAAPVASRVGSAATKVEANSAALSEAYNVIKPLIEKAMLETGQDLDKRIKEAQVIPKDTGALEQSQKVEETPEGFNIHYDSPYAARLYNHPEYKFSKEQNHNAQGKWLEVVLSTDELEQMLANNLKENM